MTDPKPEGKSDTATAGAVADPSDESLAAGVQRAFALGWHVAELCYQEAPEPTPAGIRLPQLAGLGSTARQELLVAQISADLDALALERTTPVTPLQATATREDRPGDPLSSLPEITLPPSSPDTVPDVHSAIMLRLTVKHFDLGKAYSLGVGLGQSVLEAYRLVRAQTGESPDAGKAVKAEIAGVLDRDTVFGLWSQIKDLKSRFPPYAADPVAATLWDWCKWAAGDDTAATGQPTPATGSETIADRLHRQGQIWRALLSGERKPTDVLLIGDYVDAGADILRKYWTLTGQVLVKGWPTALFSLLVVGLAVGVFFVVQHYVGNVPAALGAALGALGISWASIVAAVKAALGQAEKALWETEITAAIALAISHVPVPPADSAVVRLRRADPGLSGPAVDPLVAPPQPGVSSRLRRAMTGPRRPTSPS